jgi:hypothetical protein
VHDVDDGCGCGTVLFEELRDGLACFADVLGLQVSLRIPVSVSRVLAYRSKSVYSFWASIMTRTLSFVEALEGRTPTNSLNDFAIVNSDDFATG